MCNNCWNDFLESLPSPNTAQAYGEDLADFAKWFEQTNGQELQPDLVTSIDLREYQSHLMKVRGLKTSTVNRRLSAIKSWLKYCKETNRVKEIPNFPKQNSLPKQAPKALEKLEVARFLRALERENKPRDKALISLLLYAGLRVGEAVITKLSDIEMSERKGKVVVRSGKGSKRRAVPLNSEAREMIRPWIEKHPGGEWLFPGQKDHLTERAAQTIIKKYAFLGKLDLAKMTPHVLRHTFATRLLRAGIDIVIVAELLGHAYLDTTRRYTQPGWSELERAVEIYDN